MTTESFGNPFQIHSKERLLRDPVHGLIPIDENTQQGRLIVRLISAPEFQRLRRIRQLGLAHFAFQGAEHSRFSHSIGAYHLTCGIVAQLGKMYTLDPELAFYATVGALLHDLGHGPFSHVSERIFGIHHEQWTLRILHDFSSGVNEALTDYSKPLPSIIESLLTGMAKPGYLSSLINSELDADRLDYLLRDSLMTGVKYGVYDLDRMLHMFRISPDGDRLVVAHGGLVPVEKYIQARHHMHRQVYRHKTVIAAEAMLGSLLRRAGALLRNGDDANMEKDSILARALTEPSELSVADYLELDDTEIMYQIKRWARGATDKTIHDIAKRLLERHLFKTIEIEESTPGLNKKFDTAREAVSAAGFDPDYYLVRVDSANTAYPPYDPTSTKLSQRIWIENGQGKIVDVAKISPTIQAFTESSHRATHLVFPADGADGKLRDVLREIFSNQGDAASSTRRRK